MDEFFDACSVETFVNDGQVAVTALAFPGRESDGIELATSSEAKSVVAVQAPGGCHPSRRKNIPKLGAVISPQASRNASWREVSVWQLWRFFRADCR